MDLVDPAFTVRSRIAVVLSESFLLPPDRLMDIRKMMAC